MFLSSLLVLTSCMSTAGISQYTTPEGRPAYKTECSPLEANICNERAHDFCSRQGKKVHVLGRDIRQKYGNSSIVTHSGSFDAQESVTRGRSYKVDVLEGRFTCVS